MQVQSYELFLNLPSHYPFFFKTVGEDAPVRFAGRRSSVSAAILPGPEGGRVEPAYGLVWPAPVMRYLYVTISISPIGPRAWSFCVEMPISAPKPNCAPSVKAVDTFA